MTKHGTHNLLSSKIIFERFPIDKILLEFLIENIGAKVGGIENTIYQVQKEEGSHSSIMPCW